MPQDRDKGQTQTPASTSVPKTVAVALEVQDGRTPAKITASGRGLLAEQILQVAFANGVKVREDADLVQILSAVGVDSNIPTEAFAAVAEVLSYVYRANGQVPPPDFAELGSASRASLYFASDDGCA